MVQPSLQVVPAQPQMNFSVPLGRTTLLIHNSLYTDLINDELAMRRRICASPMNVTYNRNRGYEAGDQGDLATGPHMVEPWIITS